MTKRIYQIQHNPQGVIESVHEYRYGNDDTLANGNPISHQRTYHLQYSAFGELLGYEIVNNRVTGDSSQVYVEILIDEVLTVRYKDYLYDSETGLYYLQQRYYDPTICRFISPDTLIAEGQGTSSYNLYAYCGNNPIMYADYNGMLCFDSGVQGQIFSHGEPVYGSMYYDEYYTDEEKKVIEVLLGIDTSYTAFAFLKYDMLHYARNYFNNLPDLNTILNDWIKQDASANMYHLNTNGSQGFDALYNIKYLSPDGHREAVICFIPGQTPYIVTDPANMGTYNFGTSTFEHALFDVLPYCLYGNSPQDTTLNRVYPIKRGLNYVPAL